MRLRPISRSEVGVADVESKLSASLLAAHCILRLVFGQRAVDTEELRAEAAAVAQARLAASPEDLLAHCETPFFVARPCAIWKCFSMVGSASFAAFFSFGAWPSAPSFLNATTSFLWPSIPVFLIY